MRCGDRKKGAMRVSGSGSGIGDKSPDCFLSSGHGRNPKRLSLAFRDANVEAPYRGRGIARQLPATPLIHVDVVNRSRRSAALVVGVRVKVERPALLVLSPVFREGFRGTF